MHAITKNLHLVNPGGFKARPLVLGHYSLSSFGVKFENSNGVAIQFYFLKLLICLIVAEKCNKLVEKYAYSAYSTPSLRIIRFLLSYLSTWWKVNMYETLDTSLGKHIYFMQLSEWTRIVTFINDREETVQQGICLVIGWACLVLCVTWLVC